MKIQKKVVNIILAIFTTLTLSITNAYAVCHAEYYDSAGKLFAKADLSCAQLKASAADLAGANISVSPALATLKEGDTVLLKYSTLPADKTRLQGVKTRCTCKVESLNVKGWKGIITLNQCVPFYIPPGCNPLKQ